VVGGLVGAVIVATSVVALCLHHGRAYHCKRNHAS
jgi:hypothetical protein